jgi:hypothetical protein
VISDPTYYQNATVADEWVNQCATMYGFGEPELVEIQKSAYSFNGYCKLLNL